MLAVSDKLKGKKGFTLVELLVVLVIMAILAATVIPSMFGFVDKSKETLCQVNRQIIQRGWQYAKVFDPDMTLAEYFSSDDEYKDGAECPSGGVYTVSGNFISCSIHGSDADSGDTGTSGGGGTATMPGTDIPVTSQNYWPTQDQYINSWDRISLQPGGIFMYTDGNYYVITKQISIGKEDAESGPGGTVLCWFATEKITGKVYTEADFDSGNQMSTLSRGDICKMGNEFYVFIDGGSWGKRPDISPGQWYKLP